MIKFVKGLSAWIEEEDRISIINEHLSKGLIKVEKLERDSGCAYFWCKDGFMVEMSHDQDCCENVYIESVDSEENNAADIYTDCKWCKIEEVDSGNREALSEYDDSYTWTFYKLFTNKGYDTVRWYGTSNGYYSESVDFKIWQYDGENDIINKKFRRE